MSEGKTDALYKAHGYHTASLGKVFHHADDSPEAWSVPSWHPSMLPDASPTWRNYLLPENNAIDTLHDDPGMPGGPPYERLAVPDTAYYDGQIAREAARRLAERATADEPFFLAVGFLKPHLPFNAPERYWDLHPYEDITLPEHGALPWDAPAEAYHVHGWGELRSYRGIPAAGPVPDTLARRLIQGYRAATSYVDAQIGHVLDALDAHDLADNTVVVLWGDHGFSLGEHGLWSKHSTFEVALRVPLILRVPGQPPARVDELVELVDLYPSLVDLAGLPPPDHLQGTSFVPLLRHPEDAGRQAVYSRYFDAEAVKTDRYLFTTWFTETDSAYAQMLYDHAEDPRETVNVAPRPEYDEVVRRHRALLQQRRADYATIDPQTGRGQ